MRRFILALALLLAIAPLASADYVCANFDPCIQRLIAPIITDFTNAQHTHATAAQGGQLTASAFSSLNLSITPNLNAGMTAKSTASGTPVIFTIPTNTTITGANNFVLGSGAGATISSGTQNTVIGDNAGDGITTVSNNTLVGYDAGTGSALGASNTAVGRQALDATTNTSAANNTAVGSGALGALTTAASNVAVGQGAGATITTGSNNVFLGMGADASANNRASCIAIGTSASCAADNQVVLGASSTSATSVFIGNGVTNATPTATLNYGGTGGSGSNIAGSAITYDSGASTGSATPALVKLRSTNLGSSGSTAQTFQDRFVGGAMKCGLSDNVATTFLAGTVASGSAVGGSIDACVFVYNATDFQASCGQTTFTCVNKAGTITSNVAALGLSSATLSTGTDAVSITMQASTCNVQITSDTSLASLTRHCIVYNFQNLGDQAMTPQ